MHSYSLPILILVTVGMLTPSLDRERDLKQVQNPQPLESIIRKTRDSERERTTRQELQQLQGTWQCISLEEDGKSLPSSQLEGRTGFFGGPIFITRQKGMLLEASVLRLDPTTNPKEVDAQIVKGPGAGEVKLGIYQLDGDTLKVCFHRQGQERPTEFKAAGSGRTLVVYHRSRSESELDITGRYKSVTVQADGARTTLDATITRRGDAYQIAYTSDGALGFLGIGIRTGDFLSVCWAGKGSSGGVTVYRIEEGPKLVGQYTELNGIGILSEETLTREGNN